MSKNFAYFEDTEGGLNYFLFSCEVGLTRLNGWKTKECWKDDVEFLKWLLTAEIGEYRMHRLGICVRLRDDKP